MKISCIFTLAIILLPLSGTSQDIIFKANLPALAFNSFSPLIEVPLTGRTSFCFGAGYVIPQNKKHNSVNGSSDQYSMSAFYRGPNVTTELRVYPFSNKKPPYGFYIGGYFRYMFYQTLLVFHFEDENGKQISKGKGTAEGYGGGLTLGYQVKLGKIIALDFFAGGGIIRTKASGYFNGYGNDMRRYNSLALELVDAGKSFG